MTVNRGAVYVFMLSGGTWAQTAKLTASDGARATSSATRSRSTATRSSPGRLGPTWAANLDQGAAYTFARTGAAARNETAKLTATDGAASDFLGDSVAIDGNLGSSSVARSRATRSSPAR